MPNSWLAMLVAGGVFLLVGVAGLLWGRREATQDYHILTSRADVHTDIKKVVQNWRANSGAGSLMMGGVISIVIGLFLLVLFAVHFYRG
ncbi:MAG: hypothetical protein V1823_03305 [Chloroflexota bacterium]